MKTVTVHVTIRQESMTVKNIAASGIVHSRDVTRHCIQFPKLVKALNSDTDGLPANWRGVF
jgi:hypothetical protein